MPAPFFYAPRPKRHAAASGVPLNFTLSTSLTVNLSSPLIKCQPPHRNSRVCVIRLCAFVGSPLSFSVCMGIFGGLPFRVGPGLI